jgi:hypothetical protein
MRITGLVVTLTLAIIAGCGSGGVSSITNPPPVSAQTTYSNASLSGTYSLSLIGYATSQGNFSDFIGSFKADGNGNISSGTLTQYGTNNYLTGTCPVTFTGTYSINSDASGTASITASSAGTNGCTVSGPIKFGTEAGQQGVTLHFGESDGNGLLSGVATKQ